MASIGSTIHSIDASLLNEIKSFQTNQTAPATTQSSSGSASSDQVKLSQVGQLFKQLQQLQSSNPTEFKQVLTDAASKFQAAATSQSDPSQAQFLQGISDKFQQAADSGNLSALQPGDSSGASGRYAAHGHHHHHAAPAGGTDSSDETAAATVSSLLNSSQSGQSGTQTQTQQLLASLLAQNGVSGS